MIHGLFLEESRGQGGRVVITRGLNVLEGGRGIPFRGLCFVDFSKGLGCLDIYLILSTLM